MSVTLESLETRRGVSVSLGSLDACKKVSASLESLDACREVSASLGSLEACTRASVSLVSRFEVSHYARFARAGAPVNLESVDTRRRVSVNLVGILKETCRESV